MLLFVSPTLVHAVCVQRYVKLALALGVRPVLAQRQVLECVAHSWQLRGSAQIPRRRTAAVAGAADSLSLPILYKKNYGRTEATPSDMMLKAVLVFIVNDDSHLKRAYQHHRHSTACTLVVRWAHQPKYVAV